MEEVPGPPANSAELTLSVAARPSLCCLCIIYLHMLSQIRIIQIYMRLICQQGHKKELVRTFNNCLINCFPFFRFVFFPNNVLIFVCYVKYAVLLFCGFIFSFVNLLETSGVTFIGAQMLLPSTPRPKDRNLFLQESGLELRCIACIILTSSYILLV